MLPSRRQLNSKKTRMKISFKLAALVGVSALLFSACTPATPEAKKVDMDQVKTAIQAKEDAYAAGEKAKDAAAVAAYYSNDAISYNRNRAPSVGKAAIQSEIAARIASDSSGNLTTYKVVDLFVEGETVIEVGSYTTTNPAGAVTDSGHYMSCFRLEDGKYNCFRDMSASSMPLK